MGDNTDTRILGITRAERRTAFFEWENKMLKWAVGAILISLGTAVVVGAEWSRLNQVVVDVGAMPDPEAHKGVHNLQDQDREYIKEKVEDIAEQQEIDKIKIDNTEKNVWKIIVKMGLNK